jgi:site-specific DNA-methyltransferase (adenine-specific)
MTAKPSERVRVQLVSAERLLGSFPDRSIDLVITDPPYTSINRSSTSGHLRDWFPNGLTWPQIGRVFAVARRKLKADGVMMAMTNNDGLRDAIGALERAGFAGIRTITWDRQYPGLGGGLRHQTEFVLVGRLPGSRTLSGVDLVSVAAVGPGTAERYPTMKPDGLGRELAAMAGIGRGSLVVDPFAGSGALLVGAVERGASVVAGDVAQRAVQQASSRLAQASGKPAARTAPGMVGKRPANGKPAARPAPGRPGKRPGSTQKRATSRPASGKPATRPAPGRPGKRPGKSR